MLLWPISSLLLSYPGLEVGEAVGVDMRSVEVGLDHFVGLYPLRVLVNKIFHVFLLNIHQSHVDGVLLPNECDTISTL